MFCCSAIAFEPYFKMTRSSTSTRRKQKAKRLAGLIPKRRVPRVNRVSVWCWCWSGASSLLPQAFPPLASSLLVRFFVSFLFFLRKQKAYIAAFEGCVSDEAIILPLQIHQLLVLVVPPAIFTLSLSRSSKGCFFFGLISLSTVL